MRVLVPCFLAMMSVILGPGPVAGEPAQTSTAPAAAAGGGSLRAVIDQYCVTCHNDNLNTANLQLDHLDLTRLGADAETEENVVRKLRAGMMPPSGIMAENEYRFSSLVLGIVRSPAFRMNMVSSPGDQQQAFR